MKLKIVSIIILLFGLWILFNFASASSYCKQGEKAFLAKNYGEATLNFKKAIDKFYFNPIYHFYYAESLAHSKKFEEASSAFHKTFKLFPFTKIGKKSLDERLEIELYLDKQHYLSYQAYLKQQELKWQEAKRQEKLKRQETIKYQMEMEQRSNPPNYIDDNEKIIRWNHKEMPIKVYIDKFNAPANVDNIIKDAFYPWAYVLGGVIRYIIVNNSSDADIIVKFKNTYSEVGNICNKEEAGGCAFTVNYGNIIKSSDITIATKGWDGKALPEYAIFNTSLHEVGHALGIKGHSQVKSDIMSLGYGEYEVVLQKRSSLSKRDINTIRLIYAPTSDISNLN